MGRVTKTKLKKKLDAIFSQYIRHKYTSTETGEARCWTCGKSAPPSKLYCGHFIGRKYLATRYDPRNCRTQCYVCNVINHGEQWLFGKLLDEENPGTAERIYNERTSQRPWSTNDFSRLEAHYRKALRHEIQRLEKTGVGIAETAIRIAGVKQQQRERNEKKPGSAQII